MDIYVYQDRRFYKGIQALINIISDGFFYINTEVTFSIPLRFI